MKKTSQVKYALMMALAGMMALTVPFTAMAEEAGAGNESSSEETGSEETGSEETGSEESGSEDTGSEENGSEETGSEESGSEDTGSEESGSEDTGSEESSSEETTEEKNDDGSVTETTTTTESSVSEPEAADVPSDYETPSEEISSGTHDEAETENGSAAVDTQQDVTISENETESGATVTTTTDTVTITTTETESSSNTYTKDDPEYSENTKTDENGDTLYLVGDGSTTTTVTTETITTTTTVTQEAPGIVDVTKGDDGIERSEETDNNGTTTEKEVTYFTDGSTKTEAVVTYAPEESEEALREGQVSGTPEEFEKTLEGVKGYDEQQNETWTVYDSEGAVVSVTTKTVSEDGAVSYTTVSGTASEEKKDVEVPAEVGGKDVTAAGTETTTTTTERTEVVEFTQHTETSDTVYDIVLGTPDGETAAGILEINEDGSVTLTIGGEEVEVTVSEEDGSYSFSYNGGDYVIAASKDEVTGSETVSSEDGAVIEIPAEAEDEEGNKIYRTEDGTVYTAETSSDAETGVTTTTFTATDEEGKQTVITVEVTHGETDVDYTDIAGTLDDYEIVSSEDGVTVYSKTEDNVTITITVTETAGQVQPGEIGDIPVEDDAEGYVKDGVVYDKETLEDGTEVYTNETDGVTTIITVQTSTNENFDLEELPDAEDDSWTVESETADGVTVTTYTKYDEITGTTTVITVTETTTVSERTETTPAEVIEGEKFDVPVLNAETGKYELGGVEYTEMQVNDTTVCYSATDAATGITVTYTVVTSVDAEGRTVREYTRTEKVTDMQAADDDLSDINKLLGDYGVTTNTMTHSNRLESNYRIGENGVCNERNAGSDGSYIAPGSDGKGETFLMGEVECKLLASGNGEKHLVINLKENQELKKEGGLYKVYTYKTLGNGDKQVDWSQTYELLNYTSVTVADFNIAEEVSSVVDQLSEAAAALHEHEADIVGMSYNSNQQYYYVDASGIAKEGDGYQVVYINLNVDHNNIVEGFKDMGGLTRFTMNEDQVLVFNIDTSNCNTADMRRKFGVTVNKKDGTSVYFESDQFHDKNMQTYSQQIYFNFGDFSGKVGLERSEIGNFLAPNAAVNVNATCVGRIVANSYDSNSAWVYSGSGRAPEISRESFKEREGITTTVREENTERTASSVETTVNIQTVTKSAVRETDTTVVTKNTELSGSVEAETYSVWDGVSGGQEVTTVGKVVAWSYETDPIPVVEINRTVSTSTSKTTSSYKTYAPEEGSSGGNGGNGGSGGTSGGGSGSRGGSSSGGSSSARRSALDGVTVQIGDEEVPLGDALQVLGIQDEMIPLAALPQTGGNWPAALAALLAGMSSLGAGIAFRKKEDEE